MACSTSQYQISYDSLFNPEPSHPIVDDRPVSAGLQYATDYVANYPSNAITREYVEVNGIGAANGEHIVYDTGTGYQLRYATASAGSSDSYGTKLSVKQVRGLEERLEKIEKELFGNWRAKMNKLKRKDASDESNNDASKFFNLNNKNEWQEFFEKNNLKISKEEIIKISENFHPPKERE